MNFVEAAYQVVSHPVTHIVGTVVGAAVLWKSAKAAFKAIKAGVEHDRMLEAKVANLPSVPTFVPPQEHIRH